MRKLLLIVTLAVLAAPLASAQGARGRTSDAAPYGDIEVTFSGSGGGAYRYHDPAAGGAGASCRSPELSYAESDSYSWNVSFAFAPGGGTTQAPLAVFGSGQLSASQRLGPCAGAGPQPGACSETLAAPSPADASDLAYPSASVVIAGRQVTVGVLAELVAAAPASCSGGATLTPNPVAGWSELQASVSFPRALLARPGGYSAPVTMSGTGLWADVPLSGACSSGACEGGTCEGGQPSVGPRSSCAFGESYSGTIEIRVVR